MDEGISNISERLVASVKIVLNQYSPQRDRQEAHKVIEEFKEHSYNCAKCGFYIWKINDDPIIRHFALKLIDYHIKIRWNDMRPQHKLEIKNNTLQILSDGLGTVIKEENYIKDAMSQIIVEIIKREWPQQWPSMLSELNALCVIGEIQRELVLLIFLRLAEDIVQFQALPDQRRKDIHRTLCSNLKDLIEFFIRLLNEEYVKYSEAKQRDPKSEEALTHSRVIQITLETLAAYVDWIPVLHISENIPLFFKLCSLLCDDQLQFGAAKCLLQLVERKGKLDDRQPILVLFDENAISAIFSALSSSDTLNEKHYLFLKQLCQVLTGLGTQLASMWGIVKDVNEPSTFPIYLSCLLAFTKHPSVVISQSAQLVWLSFFRHQQIPKTSSMQMILPDLLKIEIDKLMKIGLPSENESIISDYSRLEFDSDEIFGIYFNKFRSDIVEIVRQIASYEPKLSFMLASQLLSSHCNCTAAVADGKQENLIWDVLVYYLEGVCSTISKKVQNNELPEIAVEGVRLLQLTVQFNTENPVVLSTSLSCMSSLLIFVSTSPEILPSVLDKIFSVICSNQFEDVDRARFKELKNLRRHACALLVKICTSHTKLLVVAFDQICQKVKELIMEPKLLTLLEKSTILEALIILSNEFYDYKKQLFFLHDVLNHIAAIWTTDSMKIGISSPANFITFIGLNLVSEDNDIIMPLIINRRNVKFCTDFMKGGLKRCKWPEDIEVAKKGGFLHPSSNTLKDTFFRNPLAEPIMPLLNGVFVLTRTLHLLYDPVNQAKIHPDYAGVLEINDVDKAIILGFTYVLENTDPSKSNTPKEKIKLFLNTLYDSCLHIAGRATECLGLDFYSCPDLANNINAHVMSGIEFIPDFKLKCLIRSFLRPFVTNSLPLFFDDVVKVLSVFCPFMHCKLSTRWGNFKQRYGTSIGYEDQMTEMQEVLEDQLNRQLTREYISFLGALLHKKVGNEKQDETMDEDNEQNSSSKNGTLSELGIRVLKDEGVRSAIVCTVYDALHWLDTVAALGSFRTCETVLKQLVSNQLITQPCEANYLLTSVLHGLQELGEHEANLSALLALGVKVYEHLHPQFPCLNDLLLQNTSCVERDINVFEEEVSRINTRDRRKRDLFRNIVTKIIGKNIGQHHKHNIEIQNLPPLFVPPRMKSLPLEKSIGEENLGLCEFFATPGSVS